MKKSEKIGYILGILIGLSFWIYLIYYVASELFNRIINDSGDPYPVLTLLIGIAILIRQTSLTNKFRAIQEWINK
jgi:O-antigen/teichoic acid export membrane protein